MTKEALKKEEIKKRFSLAQYYQKAVALLIKNGFYRQACDVAYNACELCAKGLILLLKDTLPKRHSGVVQLFSQLYIKEEKLPLELGKRFRKALEIRNHSRYVSEAVIDKDMTEKIRLLAEDLIKILEKETNKVK